MGQKNPDGKKTYSFVLSVRAMDGITVLAGVKGVSISEFVNSVLSEIAENNAEVINEFAKIEQARRNLASRIATN